MYIKTSKLTLTSGQSTLSGVKTDVVVLFSDLRGFSNWCETQPIENVADLMKIQFERVIQICNDHHHCFHKFLGDGFLLLWEADAEMSIDDCLRHALDATFHLHKKYWFLSQESNYLIPDGYGVGISIGQAIRIQPETFIEEMNEVDFVGYPLNCAARMQTLSSGFGTTVCSSTARIFEERSDEFLYPSMMGFRRELVQPGKTLLERAATMKGLRYADRTGFRHLIWPDSQRELWSFSGIPAA